MGWVFFLNQIRHIRAHKSIVESLKLKLNYEFWTSTPLSPQILIYKTIDN